MTDRNRAGASARSSRKTISILMTSFADTGIDSTMMRLATGLCQAGCRVDLIAMNGKGHSFRHLLDDRVRIIDLKSPRLWSSLPRLIEYLKREQPAVMISGTSLTNGFAGLANRFCGNGVLTLLTEHSIHLFSFAKEGTLKRKILRYFLKLGYRNADALVGVSAGVAAELKKLSHCDPNRVHVIYNPVWSPELEAAALRDADHPWLSNDTKIPVIVAVGRLSQEKAFDVLIRAIGLVQRKRAVRLIILGEGEQRKELTDLVLELGLDGTVDMPGFKQDPQRFMGRSAVFVLSSIHEALPTVMIEALSCGIPVVSTDCPTGPREILDGGKYGTLVAPGEPRALAEGILAALAAPVDRAELRMRAKQFSVEEAVRRYLDLIASLRPGLNLLG